MAIAYDTSSTSNNGGPTLTYSHTCSGSNRLLVIGIDGPLSGTGNTITSVTYGGVAMTQVSGSPIDKGGRFFYLYYLVNPTIGANNISVTFSSTDYIAITAASYSGVLQTGQPDATNTSQVTSGASNTVAVTTIADRCWVMGASRSASNATGQAGTTIRQNAGNALALIDSNQPKTPAGSYTLGLNLTPNQDNAMIAASFSPAAEIPSGGSFLNNFI